MPSVAGKKKGFFSRKAAPSETAAPAKSKTPLAIPDGSGAARTSPTPSAHASFTSSTAAAAATAWPVSPEAPKPMESHGLIPQSNRDRSSLRGLEWDQLGSAMAAGQRHSPPTTGKPATSPNEQQPRTKSPGPSTELGAVIREEPAGPASGSGESTGGFKSLFGRGGKGSRHSKNQSVSNSVASAASSATTAPTLPRSASMTSGTGSEAAAKGPTAGAGAGKGHASKPSASSYFSQQSSAPRSSQSSVAASQPAPVIRRMESDARSISSANTTFSAVSSLHPGASVPPPPLPSNSASFAPANGQIRPNQPPPVRVRVFIDHPTTEPLYVTVNPGTETLRSFKHKILKTDNERFIQFRQARRPPVETRWDISDSPFDDPKATGFDLDERIQLFRVSVNWLVVSKTKRAFEKTRTFTSILSCCPSTPILAADPNSLLDLGALFPPSAEAAEARLKGLIEIVVRVTPRQSIPLLVSYSDMPDHPVVVDVERGMTVRDLKETIGEARTLIVRPVGGVQNGLENSDFYLFKCAQPCHKGPLPFDIDVFEGLSPETLFDDESAVFEDHMFIERTGWDAPDMSLERVELVAFLTDDMEDDFRESLRMYTKQGEPSIRSAANSGASKRPQQQQQPSYERSPGMSPAKAYASQQRPSPQRSSANLPPPARKEDRHRSMPVQPRANNGNSPRAQAAPAPPQASPTPRNKHLSQQAPRDYRDYQPAAQYQQAPQQPRSNSNVSASNSVPNLAGLGAAVRPTGRNVPRINGTYSPVEMISPSSSPVLGAARSDSARSSPRSSTVKTFNGANTGRTPPRSPLTGGDDDASAYAETSAGPSPSIPSEAPAAAEDNVVMSHALINGLSQHKRSHDLDPLELSNVNEGLGLDDILQGYNARGSLDSLGLTMSRKPTVDGVSEGPVIENLGETIDRKLSNNSAYDVVTSANEYLAAPDPLQVKLRGKPFVGSQHGGGFTPEDVSPTSNPVPLPLEDDSPRSSESGPPSYQTNSVPPSAHGGESPERLSPSRLATAPSPQSSEKTVQQRDQVEAARDTIEPTHVADVSADYTDEDMSERAPTPDAVDDEDEIPRNDRAGSGQSDAPTDEQGPRSLRLASNASSSNKSLVSPTRGQFYHTASSGGRRNSYFNRTVATGYPLRSAMKGGKAQARAAGVLPPPPPGSPARATFRRTVNTKVGNRISRDLSNHRVGADRSSHVAIYQGKVGSMPAPMPEIPSSPSSAYSPRSQGSEDMSRKTSLGLLAEGYALIGGALFSVALKPMDERGAAVMKTSAFQNAGQLWTVQPSAAPTHHGSSF